MIAERRKTTVPKVANRLNPFLLEGYVNFDDDSDKLSLSCGECFSTGIGLLFELYLEVILYLLQGWKANSSLPRVVSFHSLPSKEINLSSSNISSGSSPPALLQLYAILS